ncbi:MULTISPECIES: class I fructose-bisphosphate aldolase [unclassified Rhizobium]|uniref:class I fructose-bisphosphate aldolase n=1 Tax=unclassified Rhizobium TaxID=2613769 RepID=UPI0007E963DA|nr:MULTISPECIES: aldolase [unclassified Rhizobium]ANM09084.1 deoxyribose-phosphate aldolase/phospho-2-dehydro-3-deoxyheptonate aldolase protein [Rhizobium sp. N324]ANM15610.1 deoxyribose-phosphate aldolase/phospho-2-dehydro-3-deoxyheptonate aldolase protein [Rhizobium sp. N541]ANM21998.1 deoxyribose-phosphate aldolase/phospho-2-dehydro-3-deoxyheptonate aldolase protein [Rhizobium sp. N941]OYD02652.1 deoxyribose-phosphate aldolase/phospho-2-dehydro-3-deoxyheptonate aldolase protein [Rhizobium sp
MKSARLNRLFGVSGNCFDVAIDHGMFNERTFLAGIENMKTAIEVIAEAGPDAIQLPPGTAPMLQAIPGKHRPALVLRTDIANIYGNPLPYVLFSEMIDRAVEQGVVLDAACVVVNLLLLPDQPEVYRACVRNVNSLKRQCEIYGMPLMVEPLVMQDNSKGAYMVDGAIDKILPLVRQAAELGADIIKADPCDNVEEYHRVVEIAQGLPVLVRGGGRVSDQEILCRTKQLMEQGARGIVYGRNVIQHHNPGGMTRALMAIVHDKASVDQASLHIG